MNFNIGENRPSEESWPSNGDSYVLGKDRVEYSLALNEVEEELDVMPEKCEVLPYPVYCIESSTDNTVRVGIDVEIVSETIDGKDVQYVRWFDTDKERMMRVSEIAEKDGYFGFVRESNVDDSPVDEYFFIPMNVEVYNEMVKDKLPYGKEFDNDDELIQAFLDTKNDADF